MNEQILTKIATLVHVKTDRQLIPNDLNKIVGIYKRFPQDRINNSTFDKLCVDIADIYIKTNNIPYKKSLSNFLINGNIEDYQVAQILQTEPHESKIKYSVREERSGNPLIHNVIESPTKLMHQVPWDRFLKEMSKIAITFENVSLPRQSVILDSINRLYNNNSHTEYSWTIHGAVALSGMLGNVQVRNEIHEAVRMTILPFWMPSRKNFYFRTVRMFIKEFIVQSKETTRFVNFYNNDAVIDHFHFEFSVENYSGQRVYLVPKNPTYTFRKPIQMVDKITTIFTDPYNTIIFDDDRAIFTLTAGIVTTFNGPITNIPTGSPVYIVNFVDPDITLQNLVNNISGYDATVTGPTSFTINIDTSAAVTPVQTNVEVIYACKRFNMELNFTTLEQ